MGNCKNSLAKEGIRGVCIDLAMQTTTEQNPPSFFKKLVRKPGKKVFWAWVTYQAVKGTLTTAFIWVPLLTVWFHHHH